jgi:glutaredoxin
MLDKLLCSSAIAVAALLLCGLPTDALAGGDWNDAAVEWRGYEAGLAEAKESGKPVCLILYTDWCPHCAKFSALFHDKAVVEEAKKFVTIRLNKEEHPAISAKYAPDGEYIPRTFFLSPAGDLDPDIHEQREKYLYFYSTAAPAGLLRGMTEALKKHGSKDAS